MRTATVSAAAAVQLASIGTAGSPDAAPCTKPVAGSLLTCAAPAPHERRSSPSHFGAVNRKPDRHQCAVVAHPRELHRRRGGRRRFRARGGVANKDASMRDPTNEAFGNVTTSVPAAGDDAATRPGPRETTASPYTTRRGYRAAALRRGPACQASGAPAQCSSWLQTRQKEAARQIVARTLLVMLLLLVVCGGSGGLFNNNTARTARCERERAYCMVWCNSTRHVQHIITWYCMAQQYTARTCCTVQTSARHHFRGGVRVSTVKLGLN